jgi:hypothetical protein
MDKATYRRSTPRTPLVLVTIIVCCGLALATTSARLAYASGDGAVAVKAAKSHVRCARGGGVRFQTFAFSPATVDEGSTAYLDQTIANCTGTIFAGSIQTSGKDVCIIVDPIQQHFRLQRHQSVTLTMTYAVPECTGTGTITGQLLSHSGQMLGKRTASFQSVVPPPAPMIVTDPVSVMVGATTQLTGTNFPANATLTIKECSQTTWIVPENPCANSNVITIASDSSGAFQTPMTAEVCPSPTPTPVAGPGFVQSCYIGQAAPQGIDTITLFGATRITVTRP